jgi:hypothetical protein
MFKSLLNITVFKILVVIMGLGLGAHAQQTSEFYFTGGNQTYTVPAGVTKIFVDALGARGGVNFYYSRPGFGGRVQCMMNVTPGQVLTIVVGEVGKGSAYNSTYSSLVFPGGFNGGGAGYGYGGSGGGATDIRIGGTAVGNRVLVAGGGGGAGYFSSTAFYERGGDGGGLTAENGYGDGNTSSTKRGVGGNQITGGAKGTYYTTGTAGSLALGGNGSTSGSSGGGGGGYYGGGGGSTGGGGGGSSYTNGIYCTNVVHTPGANGLKDGNGMVRITTIPTNANAYAYTGGIQTYTVPAGVNFVQVDMEGANGGAPLHWPSYMYKSLPGNGGRTQCIIPVTPGQTLNIYVGGAGGNGTMSGSLQVAGNGGFNGGGNGTRYSVYAAGGGGGASDIRIGGTALANRVAVAGGGGGAGQYLTTAFGSAQGGGGGGLVGQAGTAGSTSTGTIGGGTQSAGGVAGLGGVAGSLGQGGSLSTGTANPSGGGGGGYYGGGSGGYGSTTYSSGGGGGSSYTIGTASSVTHTQGYNFSGHGRVIIYPLTASVTTSSTSLSFGNIGTGATSPSQVFAMTGSLLTSGGSLTINTSSTAFEFSFDNNTWFSTAQTYTYSGTGMSGVGVFVRFKPVAAIPYSGNITISGGGLSAAVNVAVSGNGGTACGGTPAAGTALVSPGSGNATTPFTLTLSGASTGGGVAFQWQSSPNGITWTDIAGATTSVYTHSGIEGNTQFRCTSTCPSFTSATSGAGSVTFTVPVSGCIPSSTLSNSTYAVGNGTGSPVIVNGETSTINDPSFYGSGTGGSSWYYNNIALKVDFFQGKNYSAVMSNSGTCYTTGSVWIDFNDDGRFDNGTELVGGYTHVSAHASLGYVTCPTGRPNPVLRIPANATPGAHRMRVMGGYGGAQQFPGTTTWIPTYPFMNACPTSHTYYADTRDYTAIIKEPTPLLAAAPTTLNLGNTTLVDGNTVPVSYTVITGSNLKTSTGLITATAPAGFEISINGNTWASSISIPYTAATISGTNLYVRLVPTAATTYSGNIVITGGGAAAPVTVAVTGTGNATPCSGTIVAGDANATPTVGSSLTTFNLSLSGATADAGLFFQWQSSPDGSTWTNIANGIYSNYSFSGLGNTAQYRCLVWCGSGAPVASSPTTITFAAPAMAASSCIPFYSQASASCSTFGMRFQFQPFTGSAGSINDVVACTGSGYQDLTATHIVTVNAATTYTPTLFAPNGPSGNYCNSLSAQIWIDMNNNGTFETTEMVGGFAPNTVFTSSAQSTGLVTVTIPANVASGRYRMRLMSVYNSPVYPTLTPCGTTYSYGMTRDYSIYINAGAPACSGTPVAGIVNGTPQTSCEVFKANLFNVGETTNPGITWNWQSSLSPSSGFTNIAGATNATYQTNNITAPGTTYYRAMVTCGANSSTTPALPVTMNQIVDITNFTSPTATNPCPGSSSVVTVNSTSLGTATFTVTYDLSGANISSNNTAVLTMGASSGTFSIPSSLLATVGSTSVTITNIATATCNKNLTADNVATFEVSALPDISNFTSPSMSNVCIGGSGTVTVNSNSLGAGVFTATYSLAGANTATNQTATLTMGATNGTFVVPAGLLASTGVSSVTVTKITGATGCLSNVVTDNTDEFIVNTNPNISNFTTPAVTSVCRGLSTIAQINSTSLGSGAFTVTYNLTGANASSGNIGLLSMGAANGTHAIPDSLILASGATSYTIVSITNGAGCSINTTVNNNTGFTIGESSDQFEMTGGGSFCAADGGAAVGLAGSNTGNTYQLYLGSSTVGAPVAGTGAAISFGLHSAIGSYSVRATNTSSTCQRGMLTTASVLPPFSPGVYSVTGGGGYCAGGSGSAVTLANSDNGIFYQMYIDGTPIGTSMLSAGGPFSFGLQTVAGNYAVVASPGTACATTQSGTANVVINPLPTSFAMTGGGNYCAGGTGTPVGLTFGSSGVEYALFNGASPVSTVAGTNAALTFGSLTGTGTYSVVATVTATGCTNNMAGTATIGITPLPAVYAVSGGGSFCSGGSGVTVGMANADNGVSYQLYNSDGIVGAPVVATGGSFSFGSFTAAGVYTVTASASGCTENMTGSATVVVNATPPVFTTGGSTTYCSGGTGGTLTLNGSTPGVDYQLYQDGTAIGSAVAGTGEALSFGTYTTAGTYTVSATNTTTSCAANMSGSAVININATPTVFSVGGGGGFCTGALGVTVTLSGTEVGINYQLYRSGLPVGGPVAGTGSILNFGYQTEPGTYTVMASNLSTGCTAAQSGTAIVSVNSLPVVYPVTGGGNYCAGTTGIEIGVGGSEPGVNYYLYNGATLIGSPVPGAILPITFGIHTLTGTYTVFALNVATNCTNNMSGSAYIGINPLPTVYPVTGTGSYCEGGEGVAVGLSTSETGINYALYNGAAMVSNIPGTGSELSFGMQLAAGTYTVRATNATTSCVRNMAGSAVVSINTLPTQHTVTSTGSSYCLGGSGISLGCDMSTTGIDYQLYRGTTAVGIPLSGTGSPISFGMMTESGTYSVIATNPATGCTKTMLGTADVVVDALPVVYSVTGGGGYCDGDIGISIGLSGSETTATYQLYDGTLPIGAAITGTGTAISFGEITNASTYTVVATNEAGCTSNMAGAATIVKHALPNAQNVTGGGIFCSGTGGVLVGLNNSNTGINYQLYNGTTAVGIPVAGTGFALSMGTHTTVGTYMVVATNPVTGCTSNMNGFATVSSNAAPTSFAVSGGGNYCAGGAGMPITLSASTSGISYQLLNGAMPVGTPVTGTGGPLHFGTHTTAGTYFVRATNGVTGCEATMAGSATVAINPLPVVHAVTGGGNYCAGGTGLNVGISGSSNGIVYQLYNGSAPVGSLVSGTGLSIDFGIKTAAGTYSVVAFNPGTSCSVEMLGTAVIGINTLPVVHSVTGGGAYCNGGSGVTIGLSNSTPGAAYQLYNGTALVGTPALGTGSAVEFGSFTAAGTYTVRATSLSSGCTKAMSGNASVSINALPVVHTVAGGGIICQGSTGTNVYLNNSNSGINYQLYAGSVPVGAPVAGTGSAISFGPQTIAGTYTVSAANAITTCSRNMNGAVNVSVNPKPIAYNVTGGGSYCSGDAGVAIGLSGSNTGISYRLYNGTTPVGSSVAGNGGTLNFGTQSAPGNYVVVATNGATTCTNNMNGSAFVSMNTLPLVHNVTGGGAYCAGGDGVSVSLASTTTGISYQLFNGVDAVGSPKIGTGTPMSFGLQTAAGNYVVTATNTITGCDRMMNGGAAIIVNPLPVQHAVNGGGAYCNGGTGLPVGLFPSHTGISYQLFLGGMAVGSPVAGNGGAISFGNQLAAGSYNVMATNNATGCTNSMSGVAGISINELPVVYNVNGGGSLCAGATGVSVSLSNSASNIEYQLYNGTATVGMPVTGVDGPLDFGLQIVAGNYKVVAINNATTCTANMNGNAVVIVNALPAIQNVTGGGSYCAGGNGMAIGLAGSATGINYTLMLDGSWTGLQTNGTGSPVSFGTQTAAGTYEVVATNVTTGCTSDMAGAASIVVNPTPSSFAVIAGSSSYCAGDAGVTIMLNGSEPGISYQLMNGSATAGSAIAGMGSVIDFGAQTTPGNYTVVARNNATGCTAAMSGNAPVVVNALPTAYTLTGGGGYCTGNAGAAINLNGSATGTRYQLFRNGSPVGTPVTGTGTPLSFGQQVAGTYVVVATNIATTCSNTMLGSIVVTENQLPESFSITGGGTYCAGGAGVAVGISGSAVGVSYQLHNAAGMVGAAVNGTGSSLSFGSVTNAGTYFVTAKNPSTTCTNTMTGEAVVVVNALPANFAVTGGGQFCAGTAGVSVGLGGSAAGVNYQLYKGGVPVSGAILAGDGNALDFGIQTATGSYTVKANSTVNGCATFMTGGTSVIANALPVAYAVTGGGHYCESATSTGLPVGLSNSDAGVRYQLYRNGNITGVPVNGGGAITFGMQSATGEYTVKAINTTSSCTNTMAGSATIALSPAVAAGVTISSSNGSTVCIGVLTTFTAAPTNGGTTPAYQWKVNGVNVGLGQNTYKYVPANNDVVSVAMTSNNACATPATATASLTMFVSGGQIPSVEVAATPGNTVCTGTVVTYNAAAQFGGTAPAFVWKKNGVPVGSGTTFSYVPANNDIITCEMTSNFPCRLADVATSEVKMTVESPTAPLVSITANPGLNLTAGQNVRFTATATNAGTNPTYQWMINGSMVSGANEQTFTTSNLMNMDEVSCTVVNTSGPCLPTAGSKSVIVSVSAVGVNDVTTLYDDIRLLPNPNKGDFVVKGTTGLADDKELTIDITDMLGQIVYTGKVTTKAGNLDAHIRISNTLANGMYILNLRSENEKKAFHFVLQQ